MSEVRPDYASVSTTVVESGVKRPLPAGTVTFLFTDIEGSTRLLLELGDDYAAVLSEYRRALREAFDRHGGVEVDTQGDAFFVAFARRPTRSPLRRRHTTRGADPSPHGTAHR